MMLLSGCCNFQQLPDTQSVAVVFDDKELPRLTCLSNTGKHSFFLVPREVKDIVDNTAMTMLDLCLDISDDAWLCFDTAEELLSWACQEACRKASSSPNFSFLTAGRLLHEHVLDKLEQTFEFSYQGEVSQGRSHACAKTVAAPATPDEQGRALAAILFDNYRALNMEQVLVRFVSPTNPFKPKAVSKLFGSMSEHEFAQLAQDAFLEWDDQVQGYIPLFEAASAAHTSLFILFSKNQAGLERAHFVTESILSMLPTPTHVPHSSDFVFPRDLLPLKVSADSFFCPTLVELLEAAAEIPQGRKQQAKYFEACYSCSAKLPPSFSWPLPRVQLLDLTGAEDLDVCTLEQLLHVHHLHTIVLIGTKIDVVLQELAAIYRSKPSDARMKMAHCILHKLIWLPRRRATMENLVAVTTSLFPRMVPAFKKTGRFHRCLHHHQQVFELLTEVMDNEEWFDRRH